MKTFKYELLESSADKVLPSFSAEVSIKQVQEVMSTLKYKLQGSSADLVLPAPWLAMGPQLIPH